MNKIISSLGLTMCLLSMTYAADNTQLKDEKIAAVVVAGNTAEINAGTVAKTKGTSPDVRAFAKMMVLGSWLKCVTGPH